MTEEEKDASEVSEEYKVEFNKLAAGEEPSKDEPKKEDPPKEEPAPEAEGESADAAPQDDAEPSGSDEPKTEESAQDDAPPAKADEGGVVKALKDTKAWATKLAMEKATLEKELAAYKAGGASQESVKKAEVEAGETRKVLEEKIKKASEDYPELTEVLDLLAKTSEQALSKAENFDRLATAEAKRAEAREHFEAKVEPEIVKVHPDFRQVAFSKEYLDWANAQSPAIQFAAMNSLDPRDISMTLTEYKKYKASGSAEKAKSDDEKRQKGIRENLSSLRGGGSVSKTVGKPTRLEDVDPNDREAAFEFLSAQDAKK
jgi:hypothetical protein